ncbi:MAG: Uma2 family endonuclease [Bryobacterales bacterium]|nr:Uma2 family endonuclease [Bryobacterales bacterium]
MATKTLISSDEYLRTSFEDPEPDYVEGEVVERPVPNYLHSRTQVRLSDVFKPWEDRRQLFRSSEIRLRVAADRFRVTDFAVFASEQTELIPVDPPYAVVEIVSPGDRFEDLMTKLADYEQAGVEFVFVADPPVRRLSRYHRGDLFTVAALELPGYQAVIPVDSIFGKNLNA